MKLKKLQIDTGNTRDIHAQSIGIMMDALTKAIYKDEVGEPYEMPDYEQYKSDEINQM